MNKVKKLKLKNKNKQNKKDNKSKIYLSLDDLIKLRELNKNKNKSRKPKSLYENKINKNYKSDSSHMMGSSFINPNVFQNAGQVSQHNDLNSELIRSKIRLNDAYKPTGHMPPDHSFKPPSIEDVYKENMAKIGETEVNRINNKEIASKKKRAPPLEMFLCDECNNMMMYIDGIHVNLPNRNGFIYLLIGAPGMGKSSLLLSMFKNNDFYRNKFDNIFLITPLVSFQSVKKHPFALHDKVYHELNVDVLENIYQQLLEIKDECINEDYPLEKSVLIIDDYASELKNVELVGMLKQFCIKSRHLGVALIFTLQSYN